VRAVLVQARGQADPIAKAQSHRLDRIVDRAAGGELQRAEARRPVDCPERQLVRVLGIECEEEGASERIRIHCAPSGPASWHGVQRPSTRHSIGLKLAL
jgi:hypothetical protein